MHPGRSRARAARPVVRGAGRRRAGAASPRCPGSRRMPAERGSCRCGRVATRRAGRLAHDGEQAARGVEGARLHVGEGRSERALALAAPDLASARPRASETPRRPRALRVPAPGRPTARAPRDLLVGARRRARAVPGAPVRIGCGIGRLGEGAMHTLAVVGRRPRGRWRSGRVGVRTRRAPPMLSSPASTAGPAAATSMPRLSAARWSRAGSPSGSAAAASTSMRVSSGRSRRRWA